MFFSKYFSIFLLFFVFFSSCSSKNSKTINKDEKPVEISASNFLKFLNSYPSNHIYEDQVENYIEINEIVTKQIEKPYVNENILIESLKFLVPNENLGIYQIKSFESLYLLNKITLMHLLMGNPDKARVSTMQTINRMELINDFQKSEQENLDELLSTPISTLKKSIYLKSTKKRFENLNYDNDKRFANYLNGLVFEINNEKNLSDFAYEVAGFKHGKKSKNEVIIITEYGEVEPVKNETLIFDDGRYIFSMNIPYIERGKANLNSFENENCDQFFVEDYNLKLASQLDHEMNKFLVRSFIKLGLQSYLILSLDEIDDSGILSSIASLFFLFGNKVDTRHWAKIPSHLSICRIKAVDDHINIKLNNINKNIKLSEGINIVYINKSYKNATIKTVVYN